MTITRTLPCLHWTPVKKAWVLLQPIQLCNILKHWKGNHKTKCDAHHPKKFMPWQNALSLRNTLLCKRVSSNLTLKPFGSPMNDVRSLKMRTFHGTHQLETVSINGHLVKNIQQSARTHSQLPTTYNSKINFEISSVASMFSTVET